MRNFHPNALGGAFLAFVVTVPLAWAVFLLFVGMGIEPMLRSLGL